MLGTLVVRHVAPYATNEDRSNQQLIQINAR